MIEPLRNAKVGVSMLAAYGYAPVQWKIALARMQEANMAATEISPRGELTRPAIRQIAEYHLDRYFEMIEAQLSQLRRRQGSE